MKKEFKVLNLTISPDRATGLDNLLAILSEIEPFEIKGLDFIPELFVSEGTYYVFEVNSPIAQYLITNPEERKFLDMSRLVEHTINIDDKVHKAYYDLDLIALQNRILRDDFLG